MSSRVLSGETPGKVTNVAWRKVDARERFRPKPDQSSDSQTAPEEIEKIAGEAYAKGFAMGVDSSKSDAETQVRSLIERLAQNIKSLADLRPKLRRNAEEDLVKLSIAVARRILNRELSVDPNSIQGVVRVALEKLQSKEITRVRVHAAHEGAVRSALSSLSALNQIQLVADSSLQLGDLIFETTQGDFDASLEFQLREIERGFTDRLTA